MTNLENGSDLIVFSSNNFGSDQVRTSNVMIRFALRKRVFFIESAIIGVANEATYFIKKNEHEVTIVQPYLPADMSIFEQKQAMMNLVKELIIDENIMHYTVWTDTPKSMSYIRKLNSEMIVYDCINSYTNSVPELEEELFEYADVVLTSGHSTKEYEAVISSETLSLNLSHLIHDENWSETRFA